MEPHPNSWQYPLINYLPLDSRKVRNQCKVCEKDYTNLINHLRQQISCRKVYGVEFEEMIKIKSRTASRRDYQKDYYQINKETIEKHRKYKKVNQETTKIEEMFTDNFDNEQSKEDLDTSEIKTEEVFTDIQEFSRADNFVKNKDTETIIIMNAGVKIGQKRQNLKISSNFNNKAHCLGMNYYVNFLGGIGRIDFT